MRPLRQRLAGYWTVSPTTQGPILKRLLPLVEGPGKVEQGLALTVGASRSIDWLRGWVRHERQADWPMVRKTSLSPALLTPKVAAAQR